MAITVVSVADNVKRELSDLDSDLWSEDSNVLERLIVSNIVGTSNTYTFQQVATGYYVYQGKPLGLFVVGTSFYSETAGVSSTFYAGTDKQAPMIKVTTGTQTGTTIAVTATPVDFAEIIAQTLETIATRADQAPDALAAGGASLTGTTRGKRLRDLANRRRGAFGV